MDMKKTVARFALPALVIAMAASCRESDAATTNEATSSIAKASAGEGALPGTDGLQLVVSPEGNEARYRIREQLVGVDLPNDAVGATGEVSGGLGFDASGKLVPASSKFVVNVGTLKSDKDRRDGYVRNRILETSQFPTVELTPTAIRGITLPMPTSGTRTFQVVGNLTVHGVTKPTTWNVDVTFDKGRVTGTAATSFLFSDFGLNQPRVPVVLSVADSIKLEYTFSLVPKQ